MELSLDCNVVLGLRRGNPDLHSFLWEVRSSHTVLLDQAGNIEAEYLRYVDYTHRDTYDLWVLDVLYNPARTTRYGGRIPNRHLAELVKMNFHEKDLPYVHVAFCGTGSVLVSDDGRSISQPDCKRYLTEKVGIRVHGEADLPVL